MSLAQRWFGNASRRAGAVPALPPTPEVIEVDAVALKARLDAGEAVLLLDVREQFEWDQGHLQGAVHVPLTALPLHLDELDREARIVVYCHHGNRSWYAAEYLLRQGFRHAESLAGGTNAWVQVGALVR